MQNAINVLVDFASQIEFYRHLYVKTDGSTFSLTKDKPSAENLKNLIRVVLQNQNLPEPERRRVTAALAMIRTHLHNKISGLFSRCIPAQNKIQIREYINCIPLDTVVAGESQSEGEARLKFCARFSRQLHIRNTVASDLTVIKSVSEKIWNRVANDAQYQHYMALFFEGVHLQFIEEGTVTACALYQDIDAYLIGVRPEGKQFPF